MRKLRIAVGLIAGFVCAAAVARLAFGALQSVWPEYAAAVPERAYTLPMLWTRLSIAALLTVASGAAAVVVAGDRRAAWILGSLFVLVSLPSHLHYVWAEYPVWYHAVYLLSLVPLAWLGGRLPPRRLVGSDPDGSPARDRTLTHA
jgi:hypothetical protein